MRDWAPPGNAAIRKARGKLRCSPGCDDFWVPDKLEKQVARTEQCGNETGVGVLLVVGQAGTSTSTSQKKVMIWLIIGNASAA